MCFIIQGYMQVARRTRAKHRTYSVYNYSPPNHRRVEGIIHDLTRGGSSTSADDELDDKRGFGSVDSGDSKPL